MGSNPIFGTSICSVRGLTSRHAELEAAIAAEAAEIDRVAAERGHPGHPTTQRHGPRQGERGETTATLARSRIHSPARWGNGPWEPN